MRGLVDETNHKKPVKKNEIPDFVHPSRKGNIKPPASGIDVILPNSELKDIRNDRTLLEMLRRNIEVNEELIALKKSESKPQKKDKMEVDSETDVKNGSDTDVNSDAKRRAQWGFK